MTTNTDEMPFEAFSDAVGRLDEDGTVQACNAKMRRLLEALAVTRVDEIPADAVVGHEVRVVEQGDRRWLLATALDTGDRAAGCVLAGARQRALGGIAASIVHDLANLLLAGVGVAETLKHHVRDRSEAQALEELENGARQGTALGRALATLLHTSPRTWRAQSADELARDVVTIVRKHATHRGIEMTVDAGAGVDVRAPVDETAQALLHGALFCIESGARRIAVRADAATVPIEGGRPRRAARICFTAEPIEPSVGRAALAVVTGGRDVLHTISRAGIDCTGLAHARIALARIGGQLGACTRAELLELEYVLPAVSRES